MRRALLPRHTRTHTRTTHSHTHTHTHTQNHVPVAQQPHEMMMLDSAAVADGLTSRWKNLSSPPMINEQHERAVAEPRANPPPRADLSKTFSFSRRSWLFCSSDLLGGGPEG